MTGPLRILHVSEVHWGGVVSLLRLFAAEQVAAGHEVHLLAHAGMPDIHPDVHLVPWEIDRGRPWTMLHAERSLRRAVRATHPDVVHLHSWFAGALGRAPVPVPARVPVVYQPHAWSDDLSTRKAVGAAVRASERACARRTSLLVANCDDELAHGRDLRVFVPGRSIGVAVDLARFRVPTPQERSAARARLGLPEGRHLVLVLGRLTRQKGQDLLLPAWCDDPPGDATLALVGPGVERGLAQPGGEGLHHSILVPGGTDDVRPWLWAADLLALPSRYEGFPVVVAEALGTGLPVVATAVNGMTEALLGGREAVGAVVPLGDAAALVREIRRRLAAPALLGREREAAPVRAGELFAPAAVSARLEAAYRDAIARHRQLVRR